MEALKLFVVGESSSDPSKWSAWSELSLVIATTPEDAARLAARSGDVTTEVPLDRAGVLVTMPEPNHGEDH